jgi:hypothetical protein
VKAGLETLFSSEGHTCEHVKVLVVESFNLFALCIYDLTVQLMGAEWRKVCTHCCVAET